MSTQDTKQRRYSATDTETGIPLGIYWGLTPQDAAERAAAQGGISADKVEVKPYAT